MQFCALVGNLPLCVLVLGLLTVIMVQPSPSLSHDLMGLIVEKARLDDASRDRIQEAEQRRQTLKQWLTKHPSFQPLESVLRMSAAWPTDSKVTVCFFDGSMDARSQVAAIAQQWTAYGNVKLDFGELGAPRTCNCNIRSQIRVSWVST